MANIYKGGGFTVNKTILDKVIATSLARLHYDLVLGRLVDNRTADAKQQGSGYAQTVVVPRPSDGTVQDKTPGTAVTYEQISDNSSV